MREWRIRTVQYMYILWTYKAHLNVKLQGEERLERGRLAGAVLMHSRADLALEHPRYRRTAAFGLQTMRRSKHYHRVLSGTTHNDVSVY